MIRKIDEGEAPHANFSDFAQAAARQMEGIFEAQSAMTQRVQEATASLFKRSEALGAMSSELAGRLLAARTLTDATTAWQEWTVTQMRLATNDAKRMLSEAQLLYAEGANAINGARERSANGGLGAAS